MIRTEIVELTSIPAVAFRQKLASGDAGITIMRYDTEQPGLATVSRSSGDPVIAKNTPAKKYPIEAFREAIGLTNGMPYKKRGGVKLAKKAAKDLKPEKAAQVPEEEVILDSAEYQAIVAAYTDKDGKLSYQLLNRDLIRFAHASSRVRAMLAEGKKPEKIRTYIITKKFGSIAGNRKFTEAQALKAAELLDEVWPKGVFKEINDELRKKAAAAKKN